MPSWGSVFPGFQDLHGENLLVFYAFNKIDCLIPFRLRLLRSSCVFCVKAVYLTGDIERYGTGFVRVREYMRDYPEVSLDIQEKGDFFWAEVRLVKGATAQVTPHVTPHVTAKVKTLSL